LPFSFIVVTCVAGVVCLAPMGVYLLWLASVNRRSHPTVIAGAWDFAALLLGLSGFILFGGGLLLTLLQSNIRYWMRGNFQAVRDAWGQEQVTWSVIAGLYLLVVVGGAVLVLLARRRTLVVYNTDPAEFEDVVTEVFDQLGQPVERRGNLWVGSGPLFELEPFANGRTVTLRWLADDLPFFQEADRQLRLAASAAVSSGHNPSARWLMTGAAGSGMVVFVSLVLLVFGVFLR
jgi:hypothetical protein